MIMAHPNTNEKMSCRACFFSPSYVDKYMVGTHIWISWTYRLSRRKGGYRKK